MWHEGEANREKCEENVTQNIIILYSYLIILCIRGSSMIEQAAFGEASLRSSNWARSPGASNKI